MGNMSRVLTFEILWLGVERQVTDFLSQNSDFVYISIQRVLNFEIVWLI